MNIRNTPHNDFFYQVMSRKEKALAFFERYLPEKVLAMTHLETISLAESKHISDDGISLYNDVLYKCAFNEGQPGYLFAMCEHQSTPESQMPLRLLKYNLAVIEKHRKQDQGKFPVIVNIVLYHGSTPWIYSTAFADYYTNPTLGKEFLDMAPFTLINIRQLPHKVTHKDKELGFCFEAFRCTSHTDPYEAFQEALIDPIFKAYFDTLSKEFRNPVLSYLGNCIDRNKHSLADLVNLVSNDPQEKEEIMTSIMAGLAQDIKQEARQEGRQEGMHTKSLEIAKNMLSKLHLDIKAVKEVTGLSEEELMKLQGEGEEKK